MSVGGEAPNTDRRNLPGYIIDRIAEGVPDHDLRARGDGAVFRALVSTAASALAHGWDFADWHAEVTKPRKTRTLGDQARTARGGRKVLTKAESNRLLFDAWDKAEKWRAEAAPPVTSEDVTARITAVRAFLADADANLTAEERAVLADACDVAEANRTDRPAMPRRGVGERTGLGERTARTVLDRLAERGLLPVEVRGRSGTERSGKRRANLCRLPTAEAMASAYLYRGTRSMGHPAQVYGTPPVAAHGTAEQVYGTPPVAAPTDDETTDDTATIATEETSEVISSVTLVGTPAELAAALDLIQRGQSGTEAQSGRPALRVIRGGGSDDVGLTAPSSISAEATR